jgi:hypothetical protein
MAPSPFPLMHPTLVTRPFHRTGWVYEEKVEGYRMLAFKESTVAGRSGSRALSLLGSGRKYLANHPTRSRWGAELPPRSSTYPP